jgi:Tol biopolymer transport system component
VSQRDLLETTVPMGVDDAPTALGLRDARRLGRYTIECELARGGMGIVYSAYDPELQRRVALKVLTASDDEGRARLLREARAMARLAHPNVVTVYDVVTIGERDFVAMELMEGGTLADWLTARPRSQRDILVAFAAAGNGLAAAHAAGLVHRDFKPANVLRARGGRFAVTDFGLARDHEAGLPAGPRSEVMAVPAMPRGSLATITATGGVLGTPPYMAPEQWAGGEVSPATDQFAFCVSVWEALAGKRPFDGASDTVLREAIERGPSHADASSIPRALHGILARGLDPDPARRWPDVAALLAAIADATPVDERATPPSPRRRWAIAGAVAAAAIAIGIAAVAAFGGSRTTAPTPHIVRAAPLTHEADLQLDPAISPDGTRLAYASGQLGHMQLYVRPLAGGQPIALATELPGDHRWPQWSRDGSQIAFQSADGDYNSTYQIDVVPAAGGPARTFLAPPGKSVAMPVWSPDGSQLAYVQFDQHWKPPWELVVARADGTAPRTVVSLDRNESLSTPSWSPDGKHLAFSQGNIAFYLRGNLAPASIWVVAAAGGAAPTRVTSGASLDHAPIWTPDGHALLFVSDRDGSRDIYQLAVDDDGTPLGKPARLTVGLNAHVIAMVGDRRLVCSVFSYRTNVWSVDIPTGNTESTLAGARPITTGNQVIEAVDPSPDGRWLAFDSNVQGNQDIYVQPLTGGQPVAVTTDPANDFAPAWSPDGRHIAFHSFRTGSRNVFVTDVGGKQVTQITTGSANNWSPRWSPDGHTIAFFSDRSGDLDVYTVPANGGLPHQLTSQRASWPVWAPDGASIAFNDPHGLWTIPAAGGTPVQLVAAEHVSNQAWSRDGRSIYFREQEPSGLDAIWAVAATGGAPRRVLRLDDPTRHPDRVEFAVDDHRFLLPLTEHDANLWQLELDRAPAQ